MLNVREQEPYRDNLYMKGKRIRETGAGLPLSSASGSWSYIVSVQCVDALLDVREVKHHVKASSCVAANLELEVGETVRNVSLL